MSNPLHETPQNVPSSNWKLDTDLKSAAILHKLQKKQTQVDTFKGIPILKSGRAYFATDATSGRLSYLMVTKNDKIRSLNGMRYVTQTLVWRLGGGYRSGLAAHMFWKHLFPIHHVIMSDSKQTAEGKRFWIDRVSEAIELGYFIYRVNIRTGESRRVSDYGDAFGSDTYGDDDSFKLLRIVISKDQLFDSEDRT